MSAGYRSTSGIPQLAFSERALHGTNISVMLYSGEPPSAAPSLMPLILDRAAKGGAPLGSPR